MANESNPMKGFSKLPDRNARLHRLVNRGIITSAQAEMLRRDDISKEWGENFIENFVGYWPIPLGFVSIPVDGVERAIIYANEETSVVAAANKAASIFRRYQATITTEIIGDHLTLGQIVFIVDQNDLDRFQLVVAEKSAELISIMNDTLAADMISRGGGVKGVAVKNVYPRIDNNKIGVAIQVSIDTVDAMGANKVTKICEAFSDMLKKLTGCEALLAILTNNVEKLVSARVSLSGLDQDVARRVAIASRFGELDLDRAVTNNKGMLNALLAIAKATGNDDRALAMSFGTYAMTCGNYSLSSWVLEGENLNGCFRAPIDVGTVGGAVMHPSAVICLEIMKTATAKDLRRVMAAAALTQNFAALLALTDKDKHFSIGHLGLQAANYAIQVGADEDEIELVVKIIRDIGDLSVEGARTALKQIRANK